MGRILLSLFRRLLAQQWLTQCVRYLLFSRSETLEVTADEGSIERTARRGPWTLKGNPATELPAGFREADATHRGLSAPWGFHSGESRGNGSSSVVDRRASSRVGRVVEYSLAPIFPFPAAPEDGYIALTWAVNNAHSYGADPTRIAVAGRDAGGSLAGIARDRKEYKLFTRALIAPLLGPSLTRLSDTRATHAEDLDQYECARNCQAYLPDVVQRIEPRIRGIVVKETSDSDVSSKDIRRIYKGTIIAQS